MRSLARAKGLTVKLQFRIYALCFCLTVAFVVVFGLNANPPAPLAGEWPQWRGPNRDALSAEKGLLKQWGEGGPALLWKASGIGAGLSSLSIVNGKIFTMGDIEDTQYVFALSQQNGKILWRAQVGPAWKEQYGGPRSTPTVDGDLLYAIGTDGDLVCLETATGKERWRKSLTRDYAGFMMTIWAFSESPMVDGDKLVFTPGGNRAAIVAVNKKTGADIWRATIPSLGPRGKDGAGYSSIVISEGAGVKQYVQLIGRGLVSVRASDGKFLWGYNKVANDVANIPTALVRGDYVFSSTGYQTGAALLKLSKDGDGVKAEEVYFLPAQTMQNHHGGMVLVGDHIFAGHGHNRGMPICIELLTGKVLWGAVRNEGRGSAAVLYADGHLYFRYQDGRILLMEANPTEYKEKGWLQIPGVTQPSWPHLVVVDGKLYVREQDTLYVYNVRG
jgi:outer membrane protein assembly factor BamB